LRKKESFFPNSDLTAFSFLLAQLAFEKRIQDFFFQSEICYDSNLGAALRLAQARGWTLRKGWLEKKATLN
jgi:hypothetical protein